MASLNVTDGQVVLCTQPSNVDTAAVASRTTAAGVDEHRVDVRGLRAQDDLTVG